MPLTARHIPSLLTLASAAIAFMIGPARAAGTATPAAQAAPAINPADNPPQYWFGVAVENIPPAIAKQLKLNPNQGVMVIAVFANSPAARAGIRPDDLLIEVNGKPLTSQEELARAANTPNLAQIGLTESPPPLMQVSQIAYLRDGDRSTASVTPEVRPAEMAVTGANSQKFTPVAAEQAAAGAGRQSAPVRNIVLSNGSNVQYGPGYQVDASSQQNLKVLREALADGQTIIITRETDDAGHSKSTIRDGEKLYVVEPGKLDQIPANYRTLAQQLLQQSDDATRAAAVTLQSAVDTTDERLRKLEQQNEALRNQIDELKALLQSALPAPAALPPVPPAKSSAASDK